MATVSRFVSVVLGLAAFLAAAPLVAQQPAQRQQPGQRAQAGQLPQADQQLAACLIVDNQGEVAVAKIAQQRGQDAQVKRFAEKMIEDHGQFLTKLQRFAPAQRDRQEQAAEARPAERADRPAQREGGQRGLNFVALKRELGQQCLQSARKELESKEGAEFDKCFMGMQVMKHMQALDTMKVFKNHASPELAKTLDEGIETASTHLEHAKEIAKKLEGQAASTARRPEN
jgi:predicted outer membrane protein